MHSCRRWESITSRLSENRKKVQNPNVPRAFSLILVGYTKLRPVFLVYAGMLVSKWVGEYSALMHK